MDFPLDFFQKNKAFFRRMRIFHGLLLIFARACFQRHGFSLRAIRRVAMSVTACLSFGGVIASEASGVKIFNTEVSGA